jgi:glycine/D-amino acid oxidase-like deaminating enzyme
VSDCDVLVIGGGFYGCMIAGHLRRRFDRVVLVEKRPGLLERASYVNQARVHQGYHYPRSVLTALRSRVNFTRFVTEFRPCIDDTFAKYYAIGRAFSKVSAGQFERFCRRIGAPITSAPAAVRRLFNPALIEDVFRVEETAFDAAELCRTMKRRLAASGVEVRLGTAVDEVAPLPGGRVLARLGDGEACRAGMALNCTYSGLNRLLRRSGVPAIPLKHELTEMALVRVPEPLRRLGVTVMCGPFFSLMPFPAERLHSFSHVRYTPHQSWLETGFEEPPPAFQGDTPGDGYASHFRHMRLDAARYLPAVAEVRLVRSLWEVKTVLPINEGDDGRPILFQTHVGLPNLHCVLGAKIDNIYDVLDQIDARLGQYPSQEVA